MKYKEYKLTLTPIDWPSNCRWVSVCPPTIEEIIGRPIVINPHISGSYTVDFYKDLKQQLQQARREGWEQCQRESVTTIKRNPIVVSGSNNTCYQVIDNVAIEAITAMEYRELNNEH